MADQCNSPPREHMVFTEGALDQTSHYQQQLLIIIDRRPALKAGHRQLLQLKAYEDGDGDCDTVGD